MSLWDGSGGYIHTTLTAVRVTTWLVGMEVPTEL